MAGLIAAACFALLAIAPIDAHAQLRDLGGGGGGIAAPASAEECRASGSPPEDRFGSDFGRSTMSVRSRRLRARQSCRKFLEPVHLRSERSLALSEPPGSIP